MNQVVIGRKPAGRQARRPDGFAIEEISARLLVRYEPAVAAIVDRPMFWSMGMAFHSPLDQAWCSTLTVSPSTSGFKKARESQAGLITHQGERRR